MIAPCRRIGVDVQLDFVPIRVSQVQALADRMIGHPFDDGSSPLQFSLGGTEILEGVPDLDPDVVEPDAPPGGRSRGFSNLDQQQFMVGPAAGERGRPASEDPADFMESKEVPVKPKRALEVPDVPDNMAEVASLHADIIGNAKP